MKTIPLGPFLGVNNRLPDFSLRTRDGTFLRRADNVDVDNSGHLRRRGGRTLVQAMSLPHSLFASADKSVRLLVRDSALYTVSLPTYSETLLKLLASNSPMAYAEYASDIFFSNGVDFYRLNAGSVYPAALATPDQPAVVAIGGALPPGRYQVGVTYFNSTTGEEGGCAGTTNIELVTEGALQVVLPPASPGATHARVYVSQTNGEVPGLYATAALGTPTIDITSLDTTSTLMTAYQEPLPACRRLFVHNGRLCGVTPAGVLVYSEPYRPGYWVPTNYIAFEEPVSVAISAQFGVYVVADKTRWIPGDINAPEDKITDALPYGGVPGTEFVFPNSSKVGWFGAKGVVVADPQGQAEAVMADNVDLTPPASGLSVVLDGGGYRRVLSCGWCVNLENLAVSTYSAFDLTSAADGYATLVDGIYALTGSDDNGAEIQSTIRLGKQDFGTELLKRMLAVYLGVNSSSQMQARLEVPGADYTYNARACSDDLTVQRIDPGKGLRANWYDLTLMNQDGADFTLASVSFVPAAVSRRI